MRSLSPADFLDLWERGARLHPLDQGLLTLHARVFPEKSYNVWRIGPWAAAIERWRSCAAPVLGPGSKAGCPARNAAKNSNSNWTAAPWRRMASRQLKSLSWSTANPFDSPPAAIWPWPPAKPIRMPQPSAYFRPAAWSPVSLPPVSRKASRKSAHEWRWPIRWRNPPRAPVCGLREPVGGSPRHHRVSMGGSRGARQAPSFGSPCLGFGLWLDGIGDLVPE